MAGNLTQKVVFGLNDGEMVTTVEVAEGAYGGGWGVSRIEVTMRTPVRPESLSSFLAATGETVLTGGIDELIDLHNRRRPGPELGVTLATVHPPFCTPGCPPGCDGPPDDDR